MIPDQQLSLEQLEEETLEELEFHQVLEQVAKFCHSSLGREWILQSRPSVKEFWIREELSRIREVGWLLENGVPLAFEVLEDIRPLLAKARIQEAFLTPSEILRIRDVVRLSRLVKQEVRHYQQSVPYLAELCAGLHSNRLLEKHIREVIDDTAAVRDNASPELRAIRQEMIQLRTLIQQKMERWMRRLAEQGYLSDEFVTQREGRFVLPVRVEYKSKVAGIMHGVSKSGMTVFIEPAAIVELNNELAFLQDRERREIERLLRVLTAEIAVEADRWEQALEILAHLDALVAKYQFAKQYGGQHPELVERRRFRFQQVYHPLLVVQKGKDRVIPLSIEFSEQYQGYLISGPNAGGKTVALKTIGLTVALVLSGFYPLGACQIFPVRIFSSIGDHQSLEHDLSTFSSQMLRVREILRFANERSLVLIDEIAAGTDPNEGAALGMGIIDELLDRQAFVVVTTHQSSLKSYALNKRKLANASMEFDTQKLHPTYRLLPHVPGNSYAFVLAEKIGMPISVLQRAQRYRGSTQQLLEKAVEQIQQYQREVLQLRQQAEQERQAAEVMRQKYEERFERFKQKYTALMEAARQEAEELVHDARRLIERTVRELREQQLEPSAAHRRLRRLEKQIHEIARSGGGESQTPSRQAQPEIDIGSTVMIEGMSGVGVIREVIPEKQVVVVEFDNFRLKVSADRVSVVQEHSKNSTKQRQTRFGPDVMEKEISSTLDVRGYFPQEAILELDHFIARALLSPLREFVVIHGKGTGTLREELHRFLHTHPSVEAFRLGNEQEGGAGVTVVRLR